MSQSHEVSKPPGDPIVDPEFVKQLRALHALGWGSLKSSAARREGLGVAGLGLSRCGKTVSIGTSPRDSAPKMTHPPRQNDPPAAA
jgi:hypothetical protein